jgi:hypothetical protein
MNEVVLVVLREKNFLKKVFLSRSFFKKLSILFIISALMLRRILNSLPPNPGSPKTLVVFGVGVGRWRGLP